MVYDHKVTKSTTYHSSRMSTHLSSAILFTICITSTKYISMPCPIFSSYIYAMPYVVNVLIFFFFGCLPFGTWPGNIVQMFMIDIYAEVSKVMMDIYVEVSTYTLSYIWFTNRFSIWFTI